MVQIHPPLSPMTLVFPIAHWSPRHRSQARSESHKKLTLLDTSLVGHRVTASLVRAATNPGVMTSFIRSDRQSCSVASNRLVNGTQSARGLLHSVSRWVTIVGAVVMFVFVALGTYLSSTPAYSGFMPSWAVPPIVFGLIFTCAGFSLYLIGPTPEPAGEEDDRTTQKEADD